LPRGVDGPGRFCTAGTHRADSGVEKRAQRAPIDQLLAIIYALLGLAVIIAVLGIVNTLACR